MLTQPVDPEAYTNDIVNEALSQLGDEVDTTGSDLRADRGDAGARRRLILRP